jgi:cytochrome c oxidase cbb3-type subunit 4
MISGVWSGVITAVLLVVFLGAAAWAWSGRRRGEFEQAARLPLEDDDPHSDEEGRP